MLDVISYTAPWLLLRALSCFIILSNRCDSIPCSLLCLDDSLTLRELRLAVALWACASCFSKCCLLLNTWLHDWHWYILRMWTFVWCSDNSLELTNTIPQISHSYALDFIYSEASNLHIPWNCLNVSSFRCYPFPQLTLSLCGHAVTHAKWNKNML